MNFLRELEEIARTVRRMLTGTLIALIVFIVIVDMALHPHAGQPEVAPCHTSQCALHPHAPVHRGGRP